VEFKHEKECAIFQVHTNISKMEEEEVEKF